MRGVIFSEQSHQKLRSFDSESVDRLPPIALDLAGISGRSGAAFTIMRKEKGQGQAIRNGERIDGPDPVFRPDQTALRRMAKFRSETDVVWKFTS